MNAWHLGEHQVKFGKYFKYFPPLKELTSSLRFYQAVGPRGSWPLRPWGPGTVPPDSPPQDVPPMVTLAPSLGTLPDTVSIRTARLFFFVLISHTGLASPPFMCSFPLNGLTWWPFFKEKSCHLIGMQTVWRSAGRAHPRPPVPPLVQSGAQAQPPAHAQRAHTPPPAYS